MVSTILRCSVKHRTGSDAERFCPVHGDQRSADSTLAPSGLVASVLAGLPPSGTVSSVPGYEESALTSVSYMDTLDWRNADGVLHRLDGPTSATSTFDIDGGFVAFEFAINGRSATPAEVYGRYMEAMSDGVIPSTDMDDLREMLNQGALVIDERTKVISIGNQRRFDAMVDRYARTFVTPDKSKPRAVRRKTVDSNCEDEWDIEFVDGEWTRHRPFGKAIVTTDTNVGKWHWKGESVSMTRLIAHSLHEASDGAISLTNARAIEYVAANVECDASGGLYLKPYPNHSWKDIANAVAERFPNPQPGEVVRVRTFWDEPGEERGVKWVDADGLPTRDDGPAEIDGNSERTAYYLDGARVPMVAVLARTIERAGGPYVDPRNTGALKFIEENTGADYGSPENEFQISISDGDIALARLAVATHRNP